MHRSDRTEGARHGNPRGIVAAVVERDVGPELEATSHLVGSAGSGDHSRARGGRELHRRRTDTSRGGVDEHPLVRPQAPSLVQAQPGQMKREEERSRLVIVERRGRIEDHVDRRHDPFRVAAECSFGTGHHATAEPHVGSGSGSLDDPEYFHTERVGERRVDRCVAAMATVDLVEVQRRRP